MNRAWMMAGLHRRKFLSLSAAVGIAGLAGCHGPWWGKDKIQGRSQVGDDSIPELDATTTIGSKTTIGNTESIMVSGVGLVYNLPGTGSSAQPGGWRIMLESSLKKNSSLAGHLRELLDDPRKTTSLVLVSAIIPPGAAQGRSRRRADQPPGREQDDQPEGRHPSPLRTVHLRHHRATSGRSSRTASRPVRAATSSSATCGPWPRDRSWPASSSRPAARRRSRPTPTASRFTRSGASGAAAQVVRNRARTSSCSTPATRTRAWPITSPSD